MKYVALIILAALAFTFLYLLLQQWYEGWRKKGFHDYRQDMYGRWSINKYFLFVSVQVYSETFDTIEEAMVFVWKKKGILK